MTQASFVLVQSLHKHATGNVVVRLLSTIRLIGRGAIDPERPGTSVREQIFMLVCALAAWLLYFMQLQEPNSRPIPTLRRLKGPLAGAEAICPKMRISRTCALREDGDASNGSQAAGKLHRITVARQAAFTVLYFSMSLCRVLHET